MPKKPAVHTDTDLDTLPPEGSAGPQDNPPPKPKVADPTGPVPRLISDGERAPEGLKRFKLRAELNGLNGPGTRYVLARDRSSAEKHYRDSQRVPAEGSRLVVTELPD